MILIDITNERGVNSIHIESIEKYHVQKSYGVLVTSITKERYILFEKSYANTSNEYKDKVKLMRDKKFDELCEIIRLGKP